MIQKQFIMLLLVLYVVNAQIKAAPIPVDTPVTPATPNLPPIDPSVELHLAPVSKSAAGKQKYDLANSLWNAQAIFGGDFCNRCKSIKYLAFRQGSSYVTAGLTQLTLAAPLLGASGGPGAAQLFQGIQNFDGTWSFKDNLNRFIRADNNLVTLNYQFFIGPWERFYVERHDNHVHIQSAVWYQTWWVTYGLVLGQSYGGAAMYTVEWFPDLKWLWN